MWIINHRGDLEDVRGARAFRYRVLRVVGFYKKYGVLVAGTLCFSWGILSICFGMRFK